MSELYNLIASCNPNRQSLILTALDGTAAGEKAFFADGSLQWESGKEGTRDLVFFRIFLPPVLSPRTVHGSSVSFRHMNKSW